MSGSGNDNGNMDVTAEAIIALVGLVLALPPCIVLVWKWRIIRRALRSGEHTVAAEAPQEAVRRLSMDDVTPVLPLHHNRRTMTASSANTNASAMTGSSSAPSTTSKASSTFTTDTNASSTTDVSVSSGEPPEASKASCTTTVTTVPKESPESSAEDTLTTGTKTPPSFVTNLVGMTKNLLQEGDNLIASPQRIELVVVEGKVQSIHLLCRTKLSPLFRIPGYPYSLESPV